MSAGEGQGSSGKPKVIKEQFIPDHLFIYVVKGAITCYDGSQSYTLKQGDYGVVRKNRLSRYHSKKGTELNRVMFCFDEHFLRSFQEKHKPALTIFNRASTVVKIKPNEMMPAFINSLISYTDGSGKLNAAFEDVKYEELLIILLQNEPDLAGLFLTTQSLRRLIWKNL